MEIILCYPGFTCIYTDLYCRRTNDPFNTTINVLSLNGSLDGYNLNRPPVPSFQVAAATFSVASHCHNKQS